MNFFCFHKSLLAAFTVTLVATNVARAGLPQEMYIPLSNGSTTATYQGGRVVGNLYHAINTITFKSLGFIDVNSNTSNYNYFGIPDGLHDSYQVGIWLTSTHALLASTVVHPTSPIPDIFSQFHYGLIPDTTILAGQDFIVGTLLPSTLLDAWLIGANPVNNPSISGPGSGFYTTSTSLVYPSTNAFALYTIANASTAPEPATLSLLALAGATLLSRRHRRA